MAETPTFSDWSAVEATYGNQVTQMLQQNNVPLSQVGQVVQQVAPGFFAGSPAGAGFQSGGSDPGMGSFQQGQFNQQGLGQALASYFGGGGSQAPQGPSFDPTKNPNYPTSLLGAQALQAVGLNPQRQVTVNPSPANTPSSTEFAQSGVSSVASPQTVRYPASTPMPQTQGAPSIFNPATPNAPTTGQPLQPTFQYNWSPIRGKGTGTPYASVPPIQQPAGIMPVGGAPPAAPTGPYRGGQMLGFSQGIGNTAPTPGMNAPSPNAGVQKLLGALPRYQEGGIAGLDGPEVAILGEDGPEQVTPLGSDVITDPSFSQIGTQIPLGGESAQQAFDPNLAYGAQGIEQAAQPQVQTQVQQAPPAPQSGSNAGYNTLTTPGMNSFHQMAVEHQPSNIYGAPAAAQVQQADNRPGPPTPAPNAATGVNTNKVQQVPSSADQAKRQAIQNVLKEAGQIGKSFGSSMQKGGSQWSPIASAIPPPPAAPGQVQMKPPPLTNQNQNQSLAQRQAELAAYYS